MCLPRVWVCYDCKGRYRSEFKGCVCLGCGCVMTARDDIERDSKGVFALSVGVL